MTAALQGNVKAFEHVLDVAYGRKGKLKWELMDVRDVYRENMWIYSLSTHSRS